MLYSVRMKLKDETVKLLRETNISSVKIAKDCGVSLRFVGYLKQNEAARSFSIDNVQKINDYLKEANHEH